MNDTAETIIDYLNEFKIPIQETRELSHSIVIQLFSGIIITAYHSGKIVVQIRFDEDVCHEAYMILHEVLPVDAVWQISVYGDMVLINQAAGIPKIMLAPPKH